MATDFTQDAVLRFLQSSGGSVKNSDLLLHFRNFLRNHADQDRNRELFKKFVNSVATVRQQDGVSYVVLRKKFRGHSPGDGAAGSSGPRRHPDWKSSGPSPESRSPGERSGLKLQLREGPVEESPRKTSHQRLPAAGIIPSNTDSNVNVEKEQQVNTPPGRSGVSSAQVVSQVSEKTQVKAPSVCEPPVTDQCAEESQQRGGFGPSPGITPAVPAVRHHGEDQQVVPVPQTLRGREACPQTEGLHQVPPPNAHAQGPPRRFKYRQSYKSAVSYDEDEGEEDEVTERQGSTGGMWPQGVPLGDTGRVISTSLPCIIDTPVPPSVISSSSSSSSERIVPKIYIQDVEGAVLPPPHPGLTFYPGVGLKEQQTRKGPEHMSVPEESTSSRPSEDLYTPSTDPSKGASPHHSIHQDCQISQAAGVQLGPRQEPNSPTSGLSSSHSSVLSPSPDVGSSRGSGLNSSYEDLQARAANILNPDPPPTGDSYDDHEEAVSSEGSTSSPLLWQRPAVARRLSSKARNRMCLSLGADLDKVLQEEEEVKHLRGSEAARLNRLHLISSSLSLRYNLSSSSLSSCSTPPRCHSLADLVERDELGKGRRSLPASATPTTTHHDSPSKQSLVPLEPREHAWLVKGATGAWPDIYSLFREDSSLLNKQDFISGFTVLHWIAKHGDHRVLNTLWYGVQKAGLVFDINARSACGHTPLHIAAIHGHKNIIRLLVNKFDADVKLRDTAGKRPWQYLNGNTPVDIFQLLGAPARAAVGGVRRADTSWEQQQQQQQQRHRRRHHLSTASGERPFTIAGAAKVKRSSSIAALLKHKSLRRFYGHQSDSSI
ncbi:hypothetical protein INR49_017473 [Caranx melampygus]|nr:hypothetical protein INR49_017473 [Caranx melampygus]